MFVVPVGEGAEGGAAAEGAPGPADRIVEEAEPELLQAPPPAPHQQVDNFFFSNENENVEGGEDVLAGGVLDSPVRDDPIGRSPSSFVDISLPVAPFHWPVQRGCCYATFVQMFQLFGPSKPVHITE